MKIASLTDAFFRMSVWEMLRLNLLKFIMLFLKSDEWMHDWAASGCLRGLRIWGFGSWMFTRVFVTRFEEVCGWLSVLKEDEIMLLVGRANPRESAMTVRSLLPWICLPTVGTDWLPFLLFIFWIVVVAWVGAVPVG